jgi:hypothetical protein
MIDDAHATTFVQDEDKMSWVGLDLRPIVRVDELLASQGRNLSLQLGLFVSSALDLESEIFDGLVLVEVGLVVALLGHLSFGFVLSLGICEPLLKSLPLLSETRNCLLLAFDILVSFLHLELRKLQVRVSLEELNVELVRVVVLLFHQLLRLLELGRVLTSLLVLDF